MIFKMILFSVLAASAIGLQGARLKIITSKSSQTKSIQDFQNDVKKIADNFGLSFTQGPLEKGLGGSSSPKPLQDKDLDEDCKDMILQNSNIKDEIKYSILRPMIDEEKKNFLVYGKDKTINPLKDIKIFPVLNTTDSPKVGATIDIADSTNAEQSFILSPKYPSDTYKNFTQGAGLILHIDPRMFRIDSAADLEQTQWHIKARIQNAAVLPDEEELELEEREEDILLASLSPKDVGWTFTGGNKKLGIPLYGESTNADQDNKGVAFGVTFFFDNLFLKTVKFYQKKDGQNAQQDTKIYKKRVIPKPQKGG